MKFPPHVIFALAAVATLLGLGAVALLVLVKLSRLSSAQKWIAVSIVVVVAAAASAWIVFILPAYWD
jgi:hypothetical protein